MNKVEKDKAMYIWALSGSLLLSKFTHKALARLVESPLRYSTLVSPGCESHLSALSAGWAKDNI